MRKEPCGCDTCKVNYQKGAVTQPKAQPHPYLYNSRNAKANRPTFNGSEDLTPATVSTGFPAELPFVWNLFPNDLTNLFLKQQQMASDRWLGSSRASPEKESNTSLDVYIISTEVLDVRSEQGMSTCGISLRALQTSVTKAPLSPASFFADQRSRTVALLTH